MLKFVIDDRHDIVLCDEEIVAYVVKICRAQNNGYSAEKVMQTIRDAFPDEREDRLKRCIGEACRIMLAQHDQY